MTCWTSCGCSSHLSFPAVLCIALGYVENSRESSNSCLFFCLEDAPQLPALSIRVCKVADQLQGPVPDTIQTLNLAIKVSLRMLHLWRKCWG